MPEPNFRKARYSDIDSICEIRLHPAVRPFQYADRNVRSRFTAIINGELTNENACVYSIESNDSLVGYIVHSFAEIEDVKLASCGWSLHPDSWGKGVMTRTLTSFFDHLFKCDAHTHIIADCFSGNERCIKLLGRLGFTRWQYPLSQRLPAMITNRSLRWERRYGVTAEQWQALQEAAG